MQSVKNQREMPDFSAGAALMERSYARCRNHNTKASSGQEAKPQGKQSDRHPYSAISAGTVAGPANGFSSISIISSEAHAISAAAAPST